MLTISRSFINEFKKCKNDPAYFIENYVKITTLDYGMQPFLLYDYQKKIIEVLKNERFVLILQARQSGKTALISAYLIWKSLFQPNSAHCIVANKHDSAKSIMYRIKSIYENFEDKNFHIKDENRWSKTEIGFTNGSYILSCATSSNSARGLTLNTLYIDEASFIGQNGNIDEAFLQSVMPTISSGKTSQFILTSSAGAKEGFFYNLYQGSKKGENDFKVIEVSWEDVPNYKSDPHFKSNMINKIGTGQFMQEFENDFSVNLFINEVSYFDHAKLNSFEVKNFIEDESMDDFYINEAYISSYSYIVGVDISEGIGKDYSTISVFKFDKEDKTYTLVAYYQSNQVAPFVFCEKIKYVNDLYNLRSIIVERNGVGPAVIEYLTENYKLLNLFKLSYYKHHGVQIKQQSKAIGMASLKEYIENNHKMIVNSHEHINELIFYTNKGRSKRGFDDLVSSMILVAFAIQSNELEPLLHQDEDIVDFVDLITYK